MNKLREDNEEKEDRMIKMFKKKNILVTGIPGVGKTTLLIKLIKVFMDKGLAVKGFYTEDLR